MESSNSTLPKKDAWDKFQILSVALMIPFVLGFCGMKIDQTLKEREIGAKYRVKACSFLFFLW
jgi:hypothetical protein